MSLDNTWMQAQDRARKAGRILGEVLEKRVQGERPVILVSLKTTDCAVLRPDRIVHRRVYSDGSAFLPRFTRHTRRQRPRGELRRVGVLHLPPICTDRFRMGEMQECRLETAGERLELVRFRAGGCVQVSGVREHRARPVD